MRNSSKNIKFYGTTTAAKANCVSNDGRKSFSTTKNASNSHLFNYFLFIFVASLPGELSTATLPSKEASVELRNDLLCNLGSEHECICNRSLGNLDKSDYVPCHKFIEGKQLEVVSMVMRGINLNSILHTNETYEQYLRRRIARILSQYCDNMPSECPGTLADLHSSSNLVEINNRTTAVIYDEPVFARESVAILRVTFPPGKTRTEIAFVVVKRASTIQLNPTTTLNPTKVKYILSAQIAPLSRVLGGIRIEQFGIEMIAKPREYVDNTKLLIMIGIIGTSIFFCCTIAAIRQICLFRDASKRIKRPSHSAAEEEKKSTRNYGTCTEKFFSNYDLSNGHVKTKSLCSRASMNSSKKAKRGKKISKCFSEAPPGLVLADRTLAEEPSPRTYQNIFICDHSQLPKEEIDDEFEMEIQRLKRQSLQVRSPRSPFSSDDDAIAGAFQGFQFPERSPTEKSVDKRHSISDNIPSVVLNDENNEANSSFVNGETERQANENKSSETEIDLLCAISEYHPFERPLSRRGSINEEEQEEGEEGTNIDETREETPDPLGDEQQQTTADRDKEKPFILVLKRNRERPIPSESGTDEAEEETEEEDELYQPLKEEGWLSKEQVQNGKRKDDRGGKAEQLSSSEGDATTEKAMLDRHHYERLLESPGTRHDSPKIRNNKPPKIILND